LQRLVVPFERQEAAGDFSPSILPLQVAFEGLVEKGEGGVGEAFVEPPLVEYSKVALHPRDSRLISFSPLARPSLSEGIEESEKVVRPRVPYPLECRDEDRPLQWRQVAVGSRMSAKEGTVFRGGSKQRGVGEQWTENAAESIEQLEVLPWKQIK
jgi:hypothetical protein